jgi:hypothetical protein
VVQDVSEKRTTSEKRLTRDVFMITPLTILGVIALTIKYCWLDYSQSVISCIC